MALTHIEADSLPAPTRGKFAWNDENLDKLKALLLQGYSASQIGGMLGTTRNSVIGKKNRLGLSKQRARAHIDRPRRERRSRAEPWRPTLEVAPPPPEPPITMKCLTAAELADSQCSWPLGDPPNLRFCGEERAPAPPIGRRPPYCAYHWNASRRPQPRSR